MLNRKTLAIVEFFGWYGVIAILLGYFFVSFSILTPHSIIYQLLNLSGAVGIATDAFHHRDIQVGILNLIWSAVALVIIFSILIK